MKAKEAGTPGSRSIQPRLAPPPSPALPPPDAFKRLHDHGIDSTEDAADPELCSDQALAEVGIADESEGPASSTFLSLFWGTREETTPGRVAVFRRSDQIVHDSLLLAISLSRDEAMAH